ncbi:PoNe immunity protein domain-containing protein [Pseudomonas paraeruginosa]|uniref:PoNe immunity protein domain-containing protein n=1 Tax=Pseudomonas paraeruginosa TaxID=2994495 RepID=UPI0039FCE2E9
MYAPTPALDNQLADALPQWRDLARTAAVPRRNLDLADWNADWRGLFGALERFSRSHAYRQPGAVQGYAALESAWSWGSAAENASTLLLKGIDRGLPGAALRPVYRETAALWLDYARLLGAARDSLRQQGEENFEATPALAPRSGQYPFALQLLAMGVLLDAQDLLPALVEEVLLFDTDRLLDYLSAAALGLVEASGETFHPRPFGEFRAFFEAPDDSAAQALVPYLQRQYREFFQLSPKAQKKTRRLAGPESWGWWAMEVSALSVLYGWDDKALRDSPHYLADLVDYARAQGSD